MSLSRLLCLGLVFSTAVGVAEAQRLLADIDPLVVQGSSSPNGFIEFSGRAFFSATTQGLGQELVVTDGTPSGTSLVKDIQPGSSSSFTVPMAVVGSTLLLVGNDRVYGSEVWRSDGTEAGTTLLMDINPGAAAGVLGWIVSTGTLAFFQGVDPVYGAELWVTDGTSAGTRMVLDLFPGPGSSRPMSLALFDANRIIFSAVTPSVGGELWMSDGTASGTRLVKDIDPGTNSSSPSLMTRCNGRIYFSASELLSGQELWCTDGTAAGTTRVRDIHSGRFGSGIRALTCFGSELFFAAFEPSGGEELWTSDGTSAGTMRVLDIFAGGPSSRPEELTVAGGKLFFVADDGVHGKELWCSGGTAATTTLVRDIAPGLSASSASSLFADGSRLLLCASDGANGAELWESDGTTAGTQPLDEIEVGPASSSPGTFFALGSTVLFRASESTVGDELWALPSGGRTARLVADLEPPVGASGFSLRSPTYLSLPSGLILFVAQTTSTGPELWRTDGTTGGTALVKDIRPGPRASEIGSLVLLDGRAYFIATDGVSGTALWTSDGSTAGTTMVSVIDPSLFGPRSLVVFDSKLWFSGISSAANQYALWRSDGTPAGTQLFRNVVPGTISSGPANLTAAEGYLYFTVYESSTIQRLWRTDGTLTGTLPLSALNTINYLENFVTAGNRLFFMMDVDRLNPPWSPFNQVWTSDGTPAGTQQISAFNWPGAFPRAFTPFRDKILFHVFSPGAGVEPWISDGTLAGTTLLMDVNPGTQNSDPSGFTVVGNEAYFLASTPNEGSAIWRTDGTAANTALVLDPIPGPAGFARTMHRAGSASSRWLLPVFEATRGSELYLADTSNGRVDFLADIELGVESSSPTDFFSAQDRILFTAATRALGRELYVVDRSVLGAAHFESYGRGCPGTGGLVPELVGGTAPVLGSQLRLDVGRALSSTAGALLLGASRLDVPLGGGCSLLVGPMPIVASFSTDAAGSASILLPLPADPSLMGSSAYAMAAILDPNGALENAVAMTAGLYVGVGN